MADNPREVGSQAPRLDASGPRDVVFCHQCEHEWYQDEAGLVCPRCEGEITEIVTPESDPRPEREFDYANNSRNPIEIDSDPEEADIEEHVTHGPGGSVLFSRTVRTSSPRSPFGIPPRRRADPHDEHPDFVMRDFHNMLGNIMGPQFRPGQAGRSGANTLFTQDNVYGGQTFRVGGDGNGPTIVGGRFTFGVPPPRQQRGGEFQQQGVPPPVPDLATYDSPSHPLNGRSLHVVSIRAPPDQLASIIGSLFAPMGPPGQRDGPHGGGLPPGLQGLFAAMANPANARSGDAVYTQEALDQIISTLMEQHPTSNAPGPASPDAISALPKKKLDEKELGPEGKGECSVCMDDVTIGVEVVVLPCSHWFHEACASAWLSEHNTCPICRKGIEAETPPNSRRSSGQSNPSTRNEHRARRLSSIRPRMDRFSSASAAARNEARLESIRNSAGILPSQESQGPRRWHVVGDPNTSQSANDDFTPPMPGSFYRRQSDMSDSQRDNRRGNTSDSDRSRESRRSSHSGNSTPGGGAMSWIRDRFGSNRRTE
ncbi:hypothetical protein ONS95_001051 [Cadophora gregata]|uniref:uncharacterized protein n=1 Tax=Cadophora gregata TaxID=51156 RepID=UPI0026DA93B3|nr:uncharacterized protein ONS95_001051 [Cadophora gregata]KAK0129112.1 hypothetical protein ONS95_001051 [Cadophora gregata]